MLCQQLVSKFLGWRCENCWKFLGWRHKNFNCCCKFSAVRTSTAAIGYGTVVITVNVWWCLDKAIQRVQSKKRKKPCERERAGYLYALGRDKKLGKKKLFVFNCLWERCFWFLNIVPSKQKSCANHVLLIFV